MKKQGLTRIAFYGRTLKEYEAYYGFKAKDLEGRKVLDCPGGASSFTAEAVEKGIDATSIDPIHGMDPRKLLQTGLEDIEQVIEKTEQTKDLFNWTYYKSLDDLKYHRVTALERFIDSYEKGKLNSRCIRAELPYLPFKDNSFDLVLSGHLLFLYSEWFDMDFHLESIKEIYRVCAGRALIYPLQTLDAKPYPEMDALLERLENSGIKYSIVKMPFEFQKGSDRILELRANL